MGDEAERRLGTTGGHRPLKSRLQPRVLQNDTRLFGNHDGCRRRGDLTHCPIGNLADWTNRMNVPSLPAAT